MAGAQLRYLLFNGSRLLGGLGFGASAWSLADRDRSLAGRVPTRRKMITMSGSRFIGRGTKAI
jgi:hypothetical protein